METVLDVAKVEKMMAMAPPKLCEWQETKLELSTRIEADEALAKKVMLIALDVTPLKYELVTAMLPVVSCAKTPLVVFTIATASRIRLHSGALHAQLMAPPTMSLKVRPDTDRIGADENMTLSCSGPRQLTVTFVPTMLRLSAVPPLGSTHSLRYTPGSTVMVTVATWVIGKRIDALWMAAWMVGHASGSVWPHGICV